VTVVIKEADEYQIQSLAPGETEWQPDLGPQIPNPQVGARRMARAYEQWAETQGWKYRIIRRHCTTTATPWEVIPTPPIEGD
jgi:hypothetical protein